MLSKLMKPGVNPTLAACLALMSKQVDGIYEMVAEGKTGTPDSLKDKLRDTAVYCIIAEIIITDADSKS